MIFRAEESFQKTSNDLLLITDLEYMYNETNSSQFRVDFPNVTNRKEKALCTSYGAK